VVLAVLSDRIQNALASAAFAGDFRAVTYTVAHPSMKTTGEATIVPKSIECNELSAAFERNTRRGLDLSLQRTRWAWELRVRFDKEVTAELFEASLEHTPIVVPRDGEDRAAYLNLQSTVYTHPPRTASSNGTEIVFTFNATLSRL
jgi:hypothetical protein